MTARLTEWVTSLADHRVMIIGDVILDEYIIGDATRMSREAPIPVLEYRERRYIPGGAANPSANIAALGSQPVQVGVVGDDDYAEHLKREMQARGIDTGGLITCADRPTTVKTRLIARMGLRFPQQVARLDTLSREPITPTTREQIRGYITAQLGQQKALLFSDYHNGLLTRELVAEVRDHARQSGAYLTADAQGNFQKYRAFDLVKCNADEASIYLGRELRTDDDFAIAAQTLYQQLDLNDAMVITRGGQGATVYTADTAHRCPTPRVSDVFDTVGAGDTAIAVMTLARIAGVPVVDAVLLANYASGIVVQHVGNYAPSAAELIAAIETQSLT